MRSVTIGLRLWGIALEPFCCPARNGSSTSRTSVRCRWRISVANRSRPGAGQRDRLQQRGVAVARDDLRGDRLAPRARGARARAPRTPGSIAAYVPTAPLSAPTAACANARSSRCALRCASIAKPASLMPNVVGSAWTPCVRPTQTVSTCSRARAASAATSSRAPATTSSPGRAQLQRERGVEHVGRGQPEVDPAPGRPGARAEHVDERGDVVVGDPLALLDRLDGERRRADRLELVLGRRRRAPRRPRPRRAARSPSAPRRSTARRSPGACSGRSSGARARRRRPCRRPARAARAGAQVEEQQRAEDRRSTRARTPRR